MPACWFLRRSRPRFEKQAMAQVRATVAKRQRFSPTDERSIQMFGRAGISAHH